MSKITLKFLLVSVCVFATGCATIFGDSNDILTINSNDPKARLLVDGNEVGTGSAQYIMQRGDSAIITASKTGCADRSVRTRKKLVGATFLNILFWPGFIVDIATGAMQKTDPTNYTVTPKCE